MRTRSRNTPPWAALLILAWALSALGAPQPGTRAFLLPDDTTTRGDWVGAYGQHAYILFGMRGRHALFGGPGWPIGFSTETGDPTETVRGWQSSAPAHGDRSVLLEPNAIRRVPGAFDDHGETRPMGTGPDLFLDFDLAPGAFLVSLYFFEIDWIQYRAYRILVFDKSQSERPLIETGVDNFLKGKYKRFVVVGPMRVRILIERCDSPNAQTSGLFIDRLPEPDPLMFDLIRGEERDAPFRNPPAVPIAEFLAETSLNALIEHPGERTLKAYLDQERALFDAAKRLFDDSIESYCAMIENLWGKAEERLLKALASAAEGEPSWQLHLLRYYASRCRADLHGARQALSDLGREARQSAEAPGAAKRDQINKLDACVSILLGENRREESLILLETYTALQLASNDPSRAKQEMLPIARQAFEARATLPLARALSQWAKTHGDPPPEDRLLMANLFYTAGENGKAYGLFNSVEPEMNLGKQHRWVLIAMMSAALNNNDIGKAQELYDNISRLYPDSAGLDEATYRFGAHLCRMRQLEEAELWFERLLQTTRSDGYRRLSRQYLQRIHHLQMLREAAQAEHE